MIRQSQSLMTNTHRNNNYAGGVCGQTIYNPLSTPVIAASQSPESFLPSCVPHCELESLATNVHKFQLEVNTCRTKQVSAALAALLETVPERVLTNSGNA